MDETLQVTAVTELDDAARAEIRALSAAVHPPQEAGEWPGRHIEWSPAQRCVRLWNDAGALVSYASLILREGLLDGAPLRIGGVGGVMTHPGARRQGLAARVMAAAAADFAEADADLGLLVCEPRLLAYYGRLGWVPFGGETVVRQRGETQVFTFNKVMLLGVGREAPREGEIDLCGAPW